MKLTALSLLAFSVLTLFTPGGCQSCSKKTPEAKESSPPTVLAPVEKGVENLVKKNDEVEKKTDERDAAIKANVEHAHETAQTLPDSNEKEIISGDLTVVLNLLADTKANPEVKAQAARDALLIQAGKTAEAKASYARSAESGKKTAEELSKLKTDYASMETSLQGEVVSLKATIAKNTAANQKVIDNALSEAQQEARREQVKWLTIAAIVFALAGVLLAYAKFNAGEPFKAAIVAGFFGGGAFFCSILAYLLTEPWFQKFIKISVIGGSIAGVAAGIIWIVVEMRSAKEKKILAETAKALDKDATEADSTLLKVYDTIETNLAPELRAPLMEKFRGALNDNEKAYINELKAMRQRARASNPPAA